MFKSQQSLCLNPGPGYLTVHDSQGPGLGESYTYLVMFPILLAFHILLCYKIIIIIIMI